jgi:hypothetical protein
LYAVIITNLFSSFAKSKEVKTGQEAAEKTRLFVQTEGDLQNEANSFKDKVGEAIVELLNGGFFKLKPSVARHSASSHKADTTSLP